MLHDRTPLHIPKTIASSFPAAGAVVSTPADQVRFLRAFIAGELFPVHYLTEMVAHWNSVLSRLGPLDYGIGIMRLKTPRWLSPLTPVPEMIGHSGSFGTVLYHAPKHDLYISGTVNQMQPRSLPYPLLARLVAQFRSGATTPHQEMIGTPAAEHAPSGYRGTTAHTTPSSEVRLTVRRTYDHHRVSKRPPE